MTIRNDQENSGIEIVNHICAGIDIHRDTANVTMLREDPDKGISESYREFSTLKSSLIEMKNWLLSAGCHVVGIESTGRYWQPVHNVLEDEIEVILYNARNVKNIPGRKTDRSDSKWLANITRHNLIRGSFIPSKQIRDSRLISRSRSGYLQARTSLRQEVHGIMQSAGIKLSSHLSDLFGCSGRNLLRLLACNAPYNEKIIEKKVFGPLKGKVPQLMQAMDGNLRDSHRILLADALDELEHLNRLIAKTESDLKRLLLTTNDQYATYQRLQTIPGISELSSLLVLAEIGFDLSSFDGHKRFCSWAGLCPGNKESAGKRLSGRMPPKKHHLKTLLVELAWVAVKAKATHFPAKFAYHKARMGPQKAIVVIAHQLAKIIFHVVKNGSIYQECDPQIGQRTEKKRNLSTLKRMFLRVGREEFEDMFSLVSQSQTTTMSEAHT